MTLGLAEENTHSLDLVIPCYNPPEGWEQAIGNRHGTTAGGSGVIEFDGWTFLLLSRRGPRHDSYAINHWF